MNRFIHVGFYFASNAPKAKVLEPVFDGIGNWIRYAANTWIVWTDKTPDQIYQIIKPNIAEIDQILIAPLDLREYQGWMPQWVWDWIKSKTDPNALGLYAALNPAPFNYLGALGGGLPTVPPPPPPPFKKR